MRKNMPTDGFTAVHLHTESCTRIALYLVGHQDTYIEL